MRDRDHVRSVVDEAFTHVASIVGDGLAEMLEDEARLHTEHRAVWEEAARFVRERAALFCIERSLR